MITFSVDLTNNAQGGNSHIPVGAVDNYKISLQLSDADISAGGMDTIGISPVVTAINEDVTVRPVINQQ